MNRFLAAVVLIFGSLIGVASAVTYDPTVEFQLSSNPNGVWRFGYSVSGSGTYAMSLFDAVTSDGSGNQFWTSSVVNDLGNVPSFFQNNTLAVLHGVTPGQIALHPGVTALAVLRFTAPGTDLYAINGQFFAGDTGSENGSVVLNGAQASPLVYFSDTTDLSLFGFSALALTAGDTLDFVVGVTGSYAAGSTPLLVTISSGAIAVPESVGAALLLLGIVVLGVVRTRSQRWLWVQPFHRAFRFSFGR